MYQEHIFCINLAFSQQNHLVVEIVSEASQRATLLWQAIEL